MITPALPWIGFSIGLLIGFLIAVAILYKKFKTKYPEPKEAPSKKSLKTTKTTPSKKKVVKKDTYKAEVKESEPVYQAPLDYGDNYALAFFMGCIGFAITLFAIYLASWLLRKSDAPQQH